MLFSNCLFCMFCSREKLPHRTVKSYPLLQKPKPSLSPADFRDTLILSNSITGEWNPRVEMRKDRAVGISGIVEDGQVSVPREWPFVEWTSSSSSKGVFQLSKYDLGTVKDDTTKRITEKVGWNTVSVLKHNDFRQSREPCWASSSFSNHTVLLQVRGQRVAYCKKEKLDLMKWFAWP